MRHKLPICLAGLILAQPLSTSAAESSTKNDLDGDLRLFQLRPLLDSKAALGIEYLHVMEARHVSAKAIDVEMHGVPEK